MFERILIPLDGSTRAARAVPVAARIAANDDGTVILVSIVNHFILSQHLYDAGLDTIRVSTISGHVDTYNAYYRPLGYTFEEVKESLKRGHGAGLFTSINLLCFPGMIDREREVEALLAFVKETKLNLIQLRNLNIDPEVLLPRMPDLNTLGKELGIRTMIATLKRECPEVEIGNFSRPIHRASPPVNTPSQTV